MGTLNRYNISFVENQLMDSVVNVALCMEDQQQTNESRHGGAYCESNVLIGG